MSTFTGKLKKLSTKTGTGKRGKWALYSGKVEQANGDEYEEWISFGFEKPETDAGEEVEEGNYYEIEAEEDDRGYMKANSIVEIEKPRGKSSSKTSSKSSGKKTVEKEDSCSSYSTQNYIHYQSARSNALTLVELATKLDALPMIETKGKAGQAKRYAELTALVDKLTVQFYNDTNSLRLLETIDDAGAEPVTKDDDGDEEEDAAPGEDD